MRLVNLGWMAHIEAIRTNTQVLRGLGMPSLIAERIGRWAAENDVFLNDSGRGSAHPVIRYGSTDITEVVTPGGAPSVLRAMRRVRRKGQKHLRDQDRQTISG